MRVVSLAPSATNIVETLNLSDALVATTSHHQEYPSVGGWLTPNIDAIRAYNPDYILASDALQDQIVGELEDEFQMLYHQPTTLHDITQSIREIGNTLGSRHTGAVGAAKFQLSLQQRAYAPTSRPTVYCEEWMEPPMAAGNWVPEVVRLAGGTYPYRAAGERSGSITREHFERHEPDIAIFHICGKGDNITPPLKERGWSAPAVQNEQMAVLHDDFLNQPSYKLLQGLTELREQVYQWEETELATR